MLQRSLGFPPTLRSASTESTGFHLTYKVLLGFTGFYWVLLGFNRFYWVSIDFIGFYWVLPGFTRFYWVSIGFTGFYWVLLGFTGFSLGFTGSYSVLLGLTGSYLVLKWVSIGFTEFYLVLPGFTGFYWVLLGFTGTDLVSFFESFYPPMLFSSDFYRVLPSLSSKLVSFWSYPFEFFFHGVLLITEFYLVFFLPQDGCLSFAAFIHMFLSFYRF